MSVHETVVIHHPALLDDGAATSVGGTTEIAQAGPAGPAGRVLQRFGDSVEIRAGAPRDTYDGTLSEAPTVPAEVVAQLSETEQLALAALRLRASEGFHRAKRDRPREGEVWDMPGCAPELSPGRAGGPVFLDVPPPGGTLGGQGAAHGPLSASGSHGTSDYLQGSVAVGVILVNGPTAATQFTAAEREKVVAEVQAGLGWLAGFNPWAGVSFVYDIRNISIPTAANATAADDEERWRNPTMAAMGYSADWNGVTSYVDWLRSNRRTNWAYCAFFVKGYPLRHFAYARVPRVVMDYNNDGWGPDNIDRVFAHETGHIFGCPDEYASSGCTCGGSFGRFGEPNSNCENCAGAAGVGCLMRANEYAMCGPTKRHLGWGLTSLRVTQPSSCSVVSRREDNLDVFATDSTGRTVTAAWEPAMVSWWEGWWDLRGGRAAPGAPVTVVSRRRDFLDAFVVGTDGGAYTCAWEPTRGWRGWWRIGSAVFPQGARISVVSRSADKLDVFATDTSGRVLSAAWEPAFTDGWHGWWHLRGGLARPGAPVTAVVRRPDFLDIFTVGTDGRAYTAAWSPSSGGWQGWWRIRDAAFPQGAYLGATSRSADKLDVFGTDTAGRVITAAWEPAFTDGWRGWWEIRGGRAQAGAPVSVVSRSADKLDVFVVGTDNTTYTAAWEPSFSDGWRGWWNLNGGRAAHGSLITAVSRRRDFLDVFAVGQDGRVWTAAWSPGRPWAGWWPMGR